MKRFFAIFILTLILAPTMAVAPVCFAAPSIKENIDYILPPDTVKPDGSQAGQKAVPSGDLQTEILPSAIKILLGLVGTVTFAVFSYAGVMLVIAQGKEEDITKFKNILIWSLVGLVFIVTAYALVRGVMNINFQ